jgi:hypothetical protein
MEPRSQDPKNSIELPAGEQNNDAMFGDEIAFDYDDGLLTNMIENKGMEMSYFFRITLSRAFQRRKA